MSVSKGLLSAFAGGVAGAGAAMSNISKENKKTKIEKAKADALAKREVFMANLNNTNAMGLIDQQNEYNVEAAEIKRVSDESMAESERQDAKNKDFNANENDIKRQKLSNQGALDVANVGASSRERIASAGLLNKGGSDKTEKTELEKRKFAFELVKKFNEGGMGVDEFNALANGLGIGQMIETKGEIKFNGVLDKLFGKGEETIETSLKTSGGTGTNNTGSAPGGNQLDMLMDKDNASQGFNATVGEYGEGQAEDKTITQEDPGTEKIIPPQKPGLLNPNEQPSTNLPSGVNPKLPADPTMWKVESDSTGNTFVMVGKEKVPLTKEEYKLYFESRRAAMEKTLSTPNISTGELTNPTNRI